MAQRELKFRGLVRRNDGSTEWITYGIKSKPSLFGGYSWLVEDLQYTGLKDKNGKEIYEGDIVMAGSLNASTTSVIWMEVVWENSAWRVNRRVWSVSNGTDLGRLVQLNRIEVVGNVHEHEHLMKD